MVGWQASVYVSERVSPDAIQEIISRGAEVIVMQNPKGHEGDFFLEKRLWMPMISSTEHMRLKNGWHRVNLLVCSIGISFCFR